MANGEKGPLGSQKSDSKNAGKGSKFQMQELPMATPDDEYPDENLTYIAYGERGEDVAFELCDSIEEAVEIYESMKEDGFKVKLFQAQELEIVDN